MFSGGFFNTNILSDYDYIKPLGEGGQGVVSQMRHKKSEIDFVCKEHDLQMDMLQEAGFLR